MAGESGGADSGSKVEDRRAPGERDGAGDEPSSPLAPEGGAIDFATFILSLGSSVLVHLGELAHPAGEGRVNLPMAKQTLDLLALLQDKTRGNLTDEERQLLEHLLFDLRMKYVEVKRRG